MNLKVILSKLWSLISGLLLGLTSIAAAILFVIGFAYIVLKIMS